MNLDRAREVSQDKIKALQHQISEFIIELQSELEV